jgi:ketosteroid isomerase-like protein
MSQENVKIAKRALDGFNRRDVKALVALSTSDCEWCPGIGGAVDGRVYRGHQGIHTWLGELHSVWETQRLYGDEYRDLGESALLLGRIEGRGRASGVEVNAPLGAVFDLHDGKIRCLRTYLNQDEALRAAGLSV